jgi:hypothetical protein
MAAWGNCSPAIDFTGYRQIEPTFIASPPGERAVVAGAPQQVEPPAFGTSARCRPRDLAVVPIDRTSAGIFRVDVAWNKRTTVTRASAPKQIERRYAAARNKHSAGQIYYNESTRMQ